MNKNITASGHALLLACLADVVVKLIVMTIELGFNIPLL